MNIREAIQKKDEAYLAYNKSLQDVREAVSHGVPCNECGGSGGLGREYSERQCEKCVGYGAVDREPEHSFLNWSAK